MTDAPTPVVLDDQGSSPAAIPTEGVMGSGDDVVVWRRSAEVKPEPGTKFVALYEDGSGAWLGFAHDGGFIDSDGDDWEKMRNAEWWAYLPSGFRLCCEDHPDADWALTLPDHVCPPVENSPSPALGGTETEGRSEHKDHPALVGGLEPVAWRGQVVAGGVWNFRDYEMPVGDLWDAVEPLYSSSTVSTLQAENERLRKEFRRAAASLAGAASAYRTYAGRSRTVGRGKADPFFTTRAADFDKAVERARQALGGQHD